MVRLKRTFCLFVMFLVVAGEILPRAFAENIHDDLPADGNCYDITYVENDYSVCGFKIIDHEIRLFLETPEGGPIGTFATLEAMVAQDDKRLLFAMNAGMYDLNLRPVGYFVSDGKVVKEANSNDGPGNFHLKPNGIFYISKNANGRLLAGVRETSTFLNSGEKPIWATQSGPILLLDRGIHPKFRLNSTSQKKRNGVGVSGDGSEVWFAISRRRVTFHEFASLFRDRLQLSDALFLDGSISKLYAENLGRHDKGLPMGPMVGVVEAAKPGH